MTYMPVIAVLVAKVRTMRRLAWQSRSCQTERVAAVVLTARQVDSLHTVIPSSLNSSSLTWDAVKKILLLLVIVASFPVKETAKSFFKREMTEIRLTPSPRTKRTSWMTTVWSFDHFIQRIFYFKNNPKGCLPSSEFHERCDTLRLVNHARDNALFPVKKHDGWKS